MIIIIKLDQIYRNLLLLYLKLDKEVFGIVHSVINRDNGQLKDQVKMEDYGSVEINLIQCQEQNLKHYIKFGLEDNLHP